MRYRVTLVRTGVSEAHVTNVVPSWLIFVTLMIETIRSSETSVFIRSSQRNILEDSILYGYCFRAERSWSQSSSPGKREIVRLLKLSRPVLEPRIQYLQRGFPPEVSESGQENMDLQNHPSSSSRSVQYKNKFTFEHIAVGIATGHVLDAPAVRVQAPVG
jgi:hypothetical protein